MNEGKNSKKEFEYALKIKKPIFAVKLKTDVDTTRGRPPVTPLKKECIRSCLKGAVLASQRTLEWMPPLRTAAFFFSSSSSSFLFFFFLSVSVCFCFIRTVCLPLGH